MGTGKKVTNDLSQLSVFEHHFSFTLAVGFYRSPRLKQDAHLYSPY